MTARRNQSQRQLFYELRLDEVVPDNHLVRKIQALLDLSWVYAGVAPYYSKIGSPSIDPGWMIRMLIIGEQSLGLESDCGTKRMYCRHRRRSIRVPPNRPYFSRT